MKSLIDSIQAYRKAHAATILAFVGWLVASLHDGHISTPEWYALAGVFGLGGVVAAVPNRPKTAKHRRSTRPADPGYGELEFVVRVVVGLIVLPLVVWLLIALIHHIR